MSCCGCNDQPNEKNDAEPGPTKPDERGCTDFFCCCLLLLYWVGMIAVFALALMLGNPYSVIYGKDYGGFRCGLPGDGVPNASMSKIFYPQLSADLAQQRDLINTPWKIHLYGICVTRCPKQGDAVVDYGCRQPRLYPQASRSQCTTGGGRWVAPLNTQDVANRCMPVTALEQNATLVCAMPNCVQAKRPCFTKQYPEKLFWQLNPADAAAVAACTTEVRIGTTLEYRAAGAGPAEEKLAKSMQGLNQLVMTVMESKVSIFVFGVAAPIVIGFLFIFLMRWAAAPVVYFGLVALFLVMLAATTLCSFKAGLFGEELATLLELYGNHTLVRGASQAASDALSRAQSSYVNSGYSEFVDAAAVPEPSAEVYKLAAMGLLGLDCSFVAFLCMFGHQIAIAIEIIEEGSSVIAVQPSSLLYPFVTIFFLCALFVYFLVAGVFIGTLNNDGLESALTNFTHEAMGELNLTSVAGGLEPDQVSTLKNVLGIYHVLGFLWGANFLLAGSTMVIAGSVSSWFFYRNDAEEYPSSPVLASLYTTVRYHLGTIAFGSLCLAVVQLLRLALEWINNQTAEAQETNLLLKLAMSCIRCCMWCFEKAIKFVSGYAYIYVALNGDSFCSACKATFTLFLNYPAQVSVNAFVQTLLRLLQCVALPMTCSIGCYYYAQTIDGSSNPVLPSVISLVLAYVVARVFSGVYETTVDTIFVCAMRDKDKFDGRHTPEDLRRVLRI